MLRLSLSLCFPGLQHFVIEPPEPYGLPLNFKTLPETLRDAGKKHKLFNVHCNNLRTDKNMSPNTGFCESQANI